ncbi:hypothetical protein NYO67_6403 [Aspergillus flavus]|nr:hypothetical protein NYO67_6403 [Aspergillus flavus]
MSCCDIGGAIAYTDRGRPRFKGSLQTGVMTHTRTRGLSRTPLPGAPATPDERRRRRRRPTNRLDGGLQSTI